MLRLNLLILVTLGLAGGAVLLLRQQPACAPVVGEYRADGRYEGPPPAPRAKRPNLVVLVLDTVRADCIGSGAQAAADMPFVSSLAARGARFRQVTSAAPATYPSLTSMLTGLLPDAHKVDHTPTPPTLSSGITTFAEALGRGHGYATAAIMELTIPDDRYSVLQGFAHVRSGGPLRFAREEIQGWNATRDHSRPFFLLLHTYEAHDPYGELNHPWPAPAPTAEDAARTPWPESLAPAQVVEHFVLDRGMRFTWFDRSPKPVLQKVYDYCGTGFGLNPDRALAERLQRAYRGGVRWLDSEVEKTVQLLEAQGMLENTLLLITADHGEAFGEHGVLMHGRGLHEELVHVPLVAVGPEPFRGGHTLDTSLGLIDVLPTFMELAGLPPLGDIDGRSMLPDIRAGGPGRAVLSIETLTPFKMGRFADARLLSARTATESYLVTYDVTEGTILEELYDRAADPLETHNLCQDGRMPADLEVSASLAEAIESARGRIWNAVASSQEHMQLGYGSGVGAVGATRPEPPRVRKR